MGYSNKLALTEEWEPPPKASMATCPLPQWRCQGATVAAAVEARTPVLAGWAEAARGPDLLTAPYQVEPVEPKVVPGTEALERR